MLNLNDLLIWKCRKFLTADLENGKSGNILFYFKRYLKKGSEGMYRVTVCQISLLHRGWLRYLVPKIWYFDGPATPKTIGIWNPTEYIHKLL